MAPRAKPEPAGHYPQALATCIVDGIEDEFNATFVIGDPAVKVRRPRCPRRCSNVRADGLREVRCRNRCALRVGHHGPHQCRRCSFTDESHEALVADEAEADDDIEFKDTDSELDEGPDPDPDAAAPSQPIDPKVMAAVRRLHNNTGHRSNRRLARALVIAGAPAEALRAAKHLKCEICHERQRP